MTKATIDEIVCLGLFFQRDIESLMVEQGWVQWLEHQAESSNFKAQ